MQPEPTRNYGAAPPPSPRDPTRVREQPMLTTATGTMWIIVGGLFAAISFALLVAMTALPPTGVALTGAVVVAVAFVGMIVARWAVRPGRARLWMLASGMIIMAIAVVVAGLIVASSSAESLWG